jgi:predicted dehydrogenase
MEKEPMDRVRVGIVGVGNIATLNVPGYLAHEQCDVVALCDPRPDVLERRSREWGVDRTYADLGALLADPEIDAVEILGPTPLHAEHVIAAARAGKHVSVQKPIANTVSDARRMVQAARDAGVILRVTEHACYYPPLRTARDFIRSGIIGDPTVVRIKTVVGRTESEFQANLDPAGYSWRFNDQSPGGHLFDDVMHKYAMALWLVDEQVRSVQAVVRQGPLFFEAPTVALWEYARHDLLGMMEVSYAPDMFIRSDYYGADEFFEIQGTRGFVWVTRLCGNLHVDLPPLVLYDETGKRSSFAELDASYDGSFRRAAGAFVDGVLAGETPDLSPQMGIEALQLAFAVYQASNEGRAVDPATIEESVTPKGWPPTDEKMRTDVDALFAREAAREQRLSGGA